MYDCIPLIQIKKKEIKKNMLLLTAFYCKFLKVLPIENYKRRLKQNFRKMITKYLNKLIK